MELIKNLWNWIGGIGNSYCKNPHEIKSTRFLNYIAVIGSIIILVYSVASLFQFHFMYLNLFLVELSFIFILLSLLFLNKKGWFTLAKTIGVSCNILYLFFLNISTVSFLGGAYMLLATSMFPMILFNNKWIYSSFFALHIVAFFLVNYYFAHYPPLIDVALDDIKAAYPSSVIAMFVVMFFCIRYFTNTNNYYEQELLRNKQMVEQKNTEILDSIEYAKRIQNTILPPQKIVSQYLENSFILYLPKDIVAGDFYWMHSVQFDDESMSKFDNEKNTNNKHQLIDKLSNRQILFAACDCTGHGVPGAMVSVVCSNALNKAVKEFGLTEPAKILDKVAELVIEDLSKNNEENDELKDGMDASLCSLNVETGALQWAGANNALYIVPSSLRGTKQSQNLEEIASGFANLSNDELTEVRPDKQPIGKFDNPKPFTNHTIQLQKGDTIYLFTDGYADQFGGPKGKKYSKGKFKELLISIQHLPMIEQREALYNAHIQWRNTQEQVDDICVIGVRV